MRLKAIILAGLIILAGCAGPKFDSGQYNRIVTASTILSPKICFDTKTLQTSLKTFADQLDYIQIYESGLPNNDEFISMLNGVQDETIRFQNMLSKNPTVSFTYCDNKVTGIRHTLSIVLRAEGSKPQ